MASIEISRVGTSDMTALKRNFANLLQEKFGQRRIPTLKEEIARRGLVEPKIHSVKWWNSRRIADRSKVWPGHKLTPGYYWNRSREVDAKALHADLNQDSDTAAYVRAWTILNHLKEV